MARAAISLPTSTAADLSAPVLSLPLTSSSSDEAAASVGPLTVVDDLGVDVLARAEHAEARTAAAGLAQLVARAPLAAGEKGVAVWTWSRLYFFLPSLRRIFSVEYLMPLPL